MLEKFQIFKREPEKLTCLFPAEGLCFFLHISQRIEFVRMYQSRKFSVAKGNNVSDEHSVFNALLNSTIFRIKAVISQQFHLSNYRYKTMNNQYLISTASYMQLNSTEVSKDGMNESGLAAPMPTLNFEPDSFMRLTTPTEYTPRSSPPMLCKDRKHLRRNIFNSTFAEDHPTLIFPDLDDDEDLRRTKKCSLVNRLTYPSVKDIDSFMSPVPTKYTPRSSPLMFFRDRKHLSQSPLHPNFAEVDPKLNIPDFDDEEDLRRSKKSYFVQRLTQKRSSSGKIQGNTGTSHIIPFGIDA
jgi:hypothetical protein